MRLDGALKSWNDDRGFGFIEPAQGGQEIFVHIKAFPGGSGRPQVGQALTFEVELGPNGKKRAHSVQYPVRARAPRRQRAESPAPWTAPRALAIPAFVGVCYYVSQTWGVKPVVLLGYVITSVVAFFAYAFDKAAAARDSWRTQESTLHLLGLAGGWPGALLAQQLLRHKSSKPSFVAVFWFTVALNVGAFVAWHAGLLPRAWASAWDS
jgi:uncharacterized membrane protein YsdA (DUF1294 family)/cold shock CspA family protein